MRHPLSSMTENPKKGWVPEEMHLEVQFCFSVIFLILICFCLSRFSLDWLPLWLQDDFQQWLKLYASLLTSGKGKNKGVCFNQSYWSNMCHVLSPNTHWLAVLYRSLDCFNQSLAFDYSDWLGTNPDAW